MAQVVLDAIWQDIVDGKFDPEVPKVSISYEQVDRRIIWLVPVTLTSNSQYTAEQAEGY